MGNSITTLQVPQTKILQSWFILPLLLFQHEALFVSFSIIIILLQYDNIIIILLIFFDSLKDTTITSQFYILQVWENPGKVPQVYSELSSDSRIFSFFSFYNIIFYSFSFFIFL